MQRYAIHIILLFVFLHGCASVTDVPDAQRKSDLRVIDNVPFFPQEEYQCGPASLASVLNYWGVSAAPEEIGKVIYSQSAKGTLNIDMVMYAQTRGLEASHYRGAWDDLRKKIDSGFPLIVLVDYGFSVFQANHFMVIIGYNEDSVVAHSGRHERKSIPRADFLKSWEKTNYWTLFITRKP
jgi:predicted double-glycine peptidase